MTEPRFNKLIHAPTRLSIVALLAATEWADFAFVRDELALSESAMSKQLSILEEAGYLQTRKRRVGNYPRTSARLTRSGRQALGEHVAALQQMLQPPAGLKGLSRGAG